MLGADPAQRKEPRRRSWQSSISWAQPCQEQPVPGLEQEFQACPCRQSTRDAPHIPHWWAGLGLLPPRSSRREPQSPNADPAAENELSAEIFTDSKGICMCRGLSREQQDGLGWEGFQRSPHSSFPRFLVPGPGMLRARAILWDAGLRFNSSGKKSKPFSPQRCSGSPTAPALTPDVSKNVALF